MDEANDAAGTGTSPEPELTQKNTETVRGEESLAQSGTGDAESTSTHTKVGAIPSSYGAPGGADAPPPGTGEGRTPDDRAGR
ncbi:MAG TPA: hypothetical protein VFB22_12545 [Candidatus Baltobacteraceae bacterium]|nr:hypothetical protein [Candidatus Baltobacteraceae bacterium]